MIIKERLLTISNLGRKEDIKRMETDKFYMYVRNLQWFTKMDCMVRRLNEYCFTQDFVIH